VSFTFPDAGSVPPFALPKGCASRSTSTRKGEAQGAVRFTGEAGWVSEGSPGAALFASLVGGPFPFACPCRGHVPDWWYLGLRPVIAGLLLFFRSAGQPLLHEQGQRCPCVLQDLPIFRFAFLKCEKRPSPFFEAEEHVRGLFAFKHLPHPPPSRGKPRFVFSDRLEGPGPRGDSSLGKFRSFLPSSWAKG